MLDDMFDHLEGLRDQPVWQCAPDDIRASMRAPLPIEPTDLQAVHADFKDTILPYGSGNTHPGFMGWAQGGGTAVGMLAEMLAGGLNANLGGRDHMPIAVERQIVAWVREIFGFPAAADGQFLTGASQANFVALLIARTRACGAGVRTQGVSGFGQLVAYASCDVHGCVPRAMEMAGLGRDALRLIRTDECGRMDNDALRRQIARDMAKGLRPFMIVGTAGTVNVGAVDDLAGLARIAAEFRLHFHVDGALGALGILSDDLAPLFDGIELCDSLAFDFHKWAQVPYDAGFLLVRDGAWQPETFASPAAYLARAETGLAAGDWWPCDRGPDLSRGFRALKTWFTLKTYGVRALGASMATNCQLARLTADRVSAERDLVLAAPVCLNIVCFSYAPGGVEADPGINGRIVQYLHAAGEVAPSLTTLDGVQVIRAAFVNHRTTADDVDRLVSGVLAAGAALLSRA
ncbi:pyridoxal phosphate-dependent decarboxylase family protein [Sphingomonas nostoxanthinifaciens]|uniref:pyridoxal phosphate-dependent decarboxylase family protein n=1 Tax=Sphingomonas nostoxanthinifaciens TaxID=2872652 RepID=UPI001CC212B3|nr:pyridoxal-dependent decarboxylase [Sphingomonas nostoxanthinifaciens]